MNLFLKRLGYGENDRVAIVHADDYGMCQATIPAIDELFDAGIVTSAAVMVPCPWFPTAAERCRARPELDIGVHTTLTCEWNAYRWGALTTSDPVSGLVAPDGGLPRTTEQASQAEAGAVATELRAQIVRALAAGVDVTHIDSHMGVAFANSFVEHYLQLAQEYRIPAMLPRMTEPGLRERGMDAAQAQGFLQRQHANEQQGLPLIDHLTWMDLGDTSDRMAMARRVFDGLPAGLSYVILHPAVDTPELRAIAPDWRARVGDYQTFVSTGLGQYLRDSGIQTIGWRAIRDAMRAA